MTRQFVCGACDSMVIETNPHPLLCASCRPGSKRWDSLFDDNVVTPERILNVREVAYGTPADKAKKRLQAVAALMGVANQACNLGNAMRKHPVKLHEEVEAEIVQLTVALDKCFPHGWRTQLPTLERVATREDFIRDMKGLPLAPPDAPETVPDIRSDVNSEHDAVPISVK